MKENSKIKKESNRAGLYLTLIFHLVLLIVLLAYSIHTTIRQGTDYLFDFSRQEKMEMEEAEKLRREELRESVSRELDELISAAGRSVPRNVAVDASRREQSPLQDDRHANPQDIYDQAERLQRKLDASRREMEAASDSRDDILVPDRDGKDEETAGTYSGPAVISYNLDGRKAMYLPVPAYKCPMGGDVSVTVTVNRKGYVTGVKIIEAVSSPDECLREAAVQAARISRFASSPDSPERQAGEILYRFTAQ